MRGEVDIAKERFLRAAKEVCELLLRDSNEAFRFGRADYRFAGSRTVLSEKLIEYDVAKTQYEILEREYGKQSV